jgi:hypothetical protein
MKTANYWVISYGFTNGRVRPFVNESDANDYADEGNAWEDGPCTMAMKYDIINNLDALKQYCDAYNLDHSKYIKVN